MNRPRPRRAVRVDLAAGLALGVAAIGVSGFPDDEDLFDASFWRAWDRWPGVSGYGSPDLVRTTGPWRFLLDQDSEGGWFAWRRSDAGLDVEPLTELYDGDFGDYISVRGWGNASHGQWMLLAANLAAGFPTSRLRRTAVPGPVHNLTWGATLCLSCLEPIRRGKVDGDRFTWLAEQGDSEVCLSVDLQSFRMNHVPFDAGDWHGRLAAH